MKRTVRITALALIFVLCLGTLMGCDDLLETFIGKKPDSAVKDFLTAWQQKDFDTAFPYIYSSNELSGTTLSALEKGLTKYGEKDDNYLGKIVDVLCEPIAFKNVAVMNQNEETAQVSVTLTTFDMVTFTSKLVAENLECTLNNAFSGKELSVTEALEMHMDIFDKAFEETKEATVTSSVVFNLKKTEEGWKIVADRFFLNALIGDIVPFMRWFDPTL